MLGSKRNKMVTGSIDFLGELFAAYDRGLIEIRTLACRREIKAPVPRYWPLSRIDAAVSYAKDHAPAWNVYFGVLPRCRETAHGFGGHDGDISTSGVLWADIDRGDAPHEDVTILARSRASYS